MRIIKKSIVFILVFSIAIFSFSLYSRVEVYELDDEHIVAITKIGAKDETNSLEIVKEAQASNSLNKMATSTEDSSILD